MERLSDKAIDIINELHTERLDYYREYLPLIDAAQRLAHYEDLEEQGLFVELPCTVGDTVYEVQQIGKRVQPLEIISVYIGRMGGLFFNWELKDGIGIYQNIKGFGLSQIGKTVFLTRAEAALAAASGVQEG